MALLAGAIAKEDILCFLFRSIHHPFTSSVSHHSLRQRTASSCTGTDVNVAEVSLPLSYRCHFFFIELRENVRTRMELIL